MDDKALALARKAADIEEIQMVMAEYVQNCLKMDYKTSYEKLFDNQNEDVSFEFMEAGEYKGPEQVKAFMMAMHERMQSPEEKNGWMELQHLTTPKMVFNEAGTRAVAQWTILSPWAKQATPYPGDERRLTAMWFIGRYMNEFVKVDGEWKILKLHLISYIRTPFEEGWMKQPDCMRVTPFVHLRPDNPPRFYTFSSDATYTFDNIFNWGPYVPEVLE